MVQSGSSVNLNSNSVTPPIMISPVNSMLQQQSQSQINFNPNSLENAQALLNANAAALLAHQLTNNSQLGAVLGDNIIKDKINALFEQTKKEEERRRKMEEEYQNNVAIFFLLLL